MSSISLLSPDTPIKYNLTGLRVSSTLDKSVGKKHLIDGNPETCWTSQQGLPQYIQISFQTPVVPETMQLTFQGGFVGTRCAVKVPSPTGWNLLAHVFPEDINRRQEFSLQQQASSAGVNALRLEFEESSDFFGRITVYELKLLGTILNG
ncbi:galactose-binding domain-like protein [Roridomyces roridus]|uniref:Galactose-binding domain-like protein n=1 Tax=Roridomyces roridus TaxID=1738132 RepID=A0AAD7FCH2_9AGAR|nr:galactose-binding domain-like protein [Roridomyces roridus]